MSADEMWIRVKNILSYALEKYVPLSKQNTKNNRYPNYIVAALLRKKQLWCERHSPGDSQTYKDYAKKCKAIITRYHQRTEMKVISDANVHSFFPYVNSKLKNKSFVAPLKDKNNNLLTKDIKKHLF